MYHLAAIFAVPVARLMTMIGPAVIICVGHARDGGQCDADASKETRSELHPIRP